MKVNELDGRNTFGNIFLEADGGLIITSARESMSRFLQTGARTIPKQLLQDARFERKFGCFVTLKQSDIKFSLRGCVGFPEPIHKLSRALTDASIAASSEDPRFPPVKLNELDDLLVEVSILSRPELIEVRSPMELAKKINIGVDGLIMKWDFGSGLLLPQVATEMKWDAEEFLTNLSLKSGAAPDQWLLPGTQVFKFRADIFTEISPNGKVLKAQG